jgi:hypothetical protein
MSDDAVADLFRSTATVASDSDVEFTPTNRPTAGRPMTPSDEFTAVVGTACHRNVAAPKRLRLVPLTGTSLHAGPTE